MTAHFLLGYSTICYS